MINAAALAHNTHFICLFYSTNQTHTNNTQGTEPFFYIEELGMFQRALSFIFKFEFFLLQNSRPSDDIRVTALAYM